MGTFLRSTLYSEAENIANISVRSPILNCKFNKFSRFPFYKITITPIVAIIRPIPCFLLIKSLNIIADSMTVTAGCTVVTTPPFVAVVQ